MIEFLNGSKQWGIISIVATLDFSGWFWGGISWEKPEETEAPGCTISFFLTIKQGTIDRLFINGMSGGRT